MNHLGKPFEECCEPRQRAGELLVYNEALLKAKHLEGVIRETQQLLEIASRGENEPKEFYEWVSKQVFPAGFYPHDEFARWLALELGKSLGDEKGK